MTITILHIALAVLLFYAINWIGKHSSAYGYLQLSLFVRSDQAPAFNFILKTFTPSVFIILVSAACYALRFDRIVSGVWLVAVYYFAFRLMYNLILGRALLLNWLSIAAQGIAGICAAYVVYRHLIVPRRPLFPDLDSIGNQLWVLVALFVYAAFNNIRVGGEASARRKNRYLRSRLKTLQGAYEDLVKDQFPRRYMELVAYAVLIEETFNRPWIAQKLERAVFPWGSQTIGPMQVHTSTQLSDKDSVHLGLRLLRGHFQTTLTELSGKKATQYDVIRLTLAKYNRDANYISEVFELLHILWAQVAPEYRTEFEQMYITGVVGQPASSASAGRPSFVQHQVRVFSEKVHTSTSLTRRLPPRSMDAWSTRPKLWRSWERRPDRGRRPSGGRAEGLSQGQSLVSPKTASLGMTILVGLSGQGDVCSPSSHFLIANHSY